MRRCWSCRTGLPTREIAEKRMENTGKPFITCGECGTVYRPADLEIPEEEK